MSSRLSGSLPEDQGQGAGGDEPSPTAALDPELLERVLEQTLSDGFVSRLDPDGLRALADVAKRYPGATMVADPIAVELVKSVLKSHFRGFDLPDTFWRDVSQRIATALCEAPDTQEKLDRLWSQLSELDT